MADSVNPYRSALAPYFPNITGQEYKQDPSKVTHYLIYLNQKAPFDQWLHPNPNKVQTKVSQRVNALVTDKNLHPLHLCAMLNQEKMAEMLLETKVCQIDPQDYLGFTPLHHAAVNNFKNMITLFIKYGANQNLTNSRQGTYLEVLNLVHPSIDPLKQTFHYKDTQTGNIIQGNGIDFQQLTGAQAFLDKEPVISSEEIVKEWNENPASEGPNPAVIFNTVQKAYEQFKKSPPFVYVEKREDVGLNLCAGEDITSGAVVAEYLGEIKPSSSDDDKNYFFDPFDAGKKRGIAALINDGFPNCIVFPFPNTGGVRQRLIIFATCKIPKEGSIVYDYGPGHVIKFDRHLELYDKEMTAFFQNCHSLSEVYESSEKKVREMTKKNARINTFDSTIKIAYLATTPHAILKLVCDQTHSIESIFQLLNKIERYYEDYPLQKQMGTYFIYDVQQFSNALKTMEPEKANKCRKTILERMSQLNLEDLVKLMKIISQPDQ